MGVKLDARAPSQHGTSALQQAGLLFCRRTKEYQLFRCPSTRRILFTIPNQIADYAHILIIRKKNRHLFPTARTILDSISKLLSQVWPIWIINRRA